MSSGGRYLKNTPKKSNRKWVVTLAVILIVALLIGLVAGFVISKMNKIRRAEKGENSLTAEDLQGMIVEDPEPTTEATTVPTTEATEPVETKPNYGKTGKVVNVLLIGQDARHGEDSKNSDTLILCTVNKETKKLTLTSFLRDSFVYIPPFKDSYGQTHDGRTKMTLCYALGYKWGGDLGAMELMDMVIERNFGSVVDHNIEINLDAFDAFINAIGGIYVELDADETKYLNDKFKDVEDYVFEEGENKLDGWAAEEYARMRHSTAADNDFKRTNRQRIVVSKVLERIKTMSLTQINALIDEMLPMFLTDMSNSDITTYVMELLPILPELTIESQECPSAEIRGGKVVDLFGDGVPQSIITFNEADAKAIMTAITECD